ncbi:fimbrial biogenesis chaperone [Novosphingobium malaysiense]|uniref:fimbrial biogenesis chaperone n=1 Tax=Novosphingobium malaysiense TaxID=1348853 RepID=UPI000A4213EB|nr:fimbria/pilus periplasmic chaperone [Novosphingobium malaysiense]
MKKIARLALTALCAVVAPIPVATAMTVQPVVIDLQTSGKGMSQVLTVENTFTSDLPVELTIQELEMTADGVKQTGEDPGDLLVFPPQALIPPGQTQSFRVQYVGNPDLEKSHHYYITVAQLPVKLPEGQSAIQILYNFQVLVSVGPSGVKPDFAIDSAQIGSNAAGKPVPVLQIRNDAATYGYLSNGHLRIVEKDAAGKQIFSKSLSAAEIQQTMGFGLIGSGQERKITVPVELPTAEGSLEASFSFDR